MKANWLKLTFVAGTMLCSSLSIAQKINETNAAMEYKKFQMAMFQETPDLEAAKKALTKGKGYIDLAAAHEETKENQKTLYYKGAIYSAFLSVGMASMDTTFIKQIGDNGMDIAAEALKNGYSKTGKMKTDIEDCAKQNQAQLFNIAGMLYNNNNFKEAAEVYMSEAKFGEAINILDTNAYFNAGLCYERVQDYANAAKSYSILAKAEYKGGMGYALAAGAYRKNKQMEEAKAMVAEGRKKYPTDKDLILEAVNIHIDMNDQAGAEAALNEAIANDPNNKLLHYNIGTVYSQLKQHEKAEIALNKALAIDAEYDDALYQLGAVLIDWASDIRKAANDLKPGDKRYDVMNKQADEIYRRALPPLEKYIGKNPNDKFVLQTISKLYRSLGNLEKSAEYKKRADAIQ